MRGPATFYPSLCLLLACCGGSGPNMGVPATATPATRPPSDGLVKTATVLVDASAEAGIVFKNLCGDPDKPYLFDSVGAGVAWLDFDRDGDLDAYLVNGSTLARLSASEPGEPSRLFRNDGGRFTDVTDTAGVANIGPGTWGMGVTSADYDADGWVDLYVTNWGRDVLYRNLGDGRFEDATSAAGLGDPRMSTNAAFGDIDGDGDLDLYVSNYVQFDPANPQVKPMGCQWEGIPALCGPATLRGELPTLYRNDGDGRFTDVSLESGVRSQGGRQGFAVVFGDYDLDGDEDIFVAIDTNLSFLWYNDGHGKFVDGGLAAGIALSESGKPQAGMGVAVGDYDNDGDEDIYVTHFDLDYDALFRNDRGAFTDVSHSLGIVAATWNNLAWGAGFFDWDNDADLDLFVANGHIYPHIKQIQGKHYEQHASFFDNDGGRFREISRTGHPGLEIRRSMRGAGFADYDNDGDVDVLVSNIDSAPHVVRNDGGNRAPWIKVVLEDETSNRDAFGAWVRVRTGSITQHRQMRVAYSFGSANDPRLHFGLGNATVVDDIEVVWPDGTVEKISGPQPARRLLRIHRGHGVIAAGEFPGAP